MKRTRTLDQLARGTERYVQHAKTGRRNRTLAASIFDLCDMIRDGADSEAARGIAKRIATDTETLIRLAHTADGTEFYAAWTRQRDAIADLRAIVASEDSAL